MTLCRSSSQTLLWITSKRGMNLCCQLITQAKSLGCLLDLDWNNLVMWWITRWKRRLCSHSPTTSGLLRIATMTCTWNHSTRLGTRVISGQTSSKLRIHASWSKETIIAKLRNSRCRHRLCTITIKSSQLSWNHLRSIVRNATFHFLAKKINTISSTKLKWNLRDFQKLSTNATKPDAQPCLKLVFHYFKISQRNRLLIWWATSSQISGSTCLISDWRSNNRTTSSTRMTSV